MLLFGKGLLGRLNTASPRSDAFPRERSTKRENEQLFEANPKNDIRSSRSKTGGLRPWDQRVDSRSQALAIRRQPLRRPRQEESRGVRRRARETPKPHESSTTSARKPASTQACAREARGDHGVGHQPSARMPNYDGHSPAMLRRIAAGLNERVEDSASVPPKRATGTA